MTRPGTIRGGGPIPPAMVEAEQVLSIDAWEVLRTKEATSQLIEAWESWLADLLDGDVTADDAVTAKDAADTAAWNRQAFGVRIGLLYGLMLAERGDGSTPTAAEASQVLLDAASWLDADARVEDWPEWKAQQLERIKDMVVPRASAEEQEENRLVVERLLSMKRATETAAVSEAVEAATSLWRSLLGVDLVTATVDQLLELDRLHETATLEARVRSAQILDTRPEWTGNE